MKRWLFPYLFALVGILIPVLPAQAGPPVYAGNLQVTNGANLSFLAGGTGCLLVNNGVAYVAACPVGTVAFQAAAPFSVTGSGPYVIGCPTCFTTSGGTILGATTFSNTVTVNAASGFSQPLTVSAGGGVQIGAAAQYGTHNSNAPTVIQFPNTTSASGDSYIGSNSLVSVQGYACNVLGIGNFGFNPDICIDNAGHFSTADQIYATQFNVVSRRAWKYDIQPLSLDALQVLHDTDFASFRYRKGHGDPRVPHIGIIADDSPSIVSGEKHDHLDLEALATVDAQAILQLDTQIKVLYIICFALTALLVAAIGLAVRRA